MLIIEFVRIRNSGIELMDSVSTVERIDVDAFDIDCQCLPDLHKNKIDEVNSKLWQ